jgi:CDP-diacylglycerol---glycerol-3-phosphate 3-phosphatidyltransferase
MNSKQIPNMVTMSRLVLAIAAFWFMGELSATEPRSAEQLKNASFWAFWLFVLASSSDFLDGWLARKYGWVSAFGRVADPVVDKVLTLGSLIYLAAAAPLFDQPGDYLPVMPVWVVVLMLAREFLVTALRGLVESRGLSFAADRYGKLKLILQVVYIGVPLGILGGIPEFLHLEFLQYTREPHLYAAMFVLMVGLTVVSGVNYILRGAKMLNAADSGDGSIATG